jgi:hypothetical protein
MPKPALSREQKLERKEAISDRMYFMGAGAIAIGLGFFHPRPAFALIAAGAFVTLPPMLDLLSAFIRGVRRRT